MILLESAEILAAVRRSLEAHVLTVLDDDFARLQVMSAIKAIDDVVDRLERGSPITRSGERVARGLSEVAASVAEDHAEAASALRDLAGSSMSADSGRGALDELFAGAFGVAQSYPDVRDAILRVFDQESSLTTMEDNQWMCREAIESLQ